MPMTAAIKIPMRPLNGMSGELSNKPVTVFTLKHMQKLIVEACLNFLITMPHHRAFAFRTPRGSVLDGFKHWALPFLLQAGARSVSQPSTPGQRRGR